MLGSQILITGLFAVSLDLILGYAGIVSLGHAAYFGIGAYAAGLLAVHGWGEPFSGLVVAGAAGAVVGFATSFLVVRGSDLARLMVTLGIGLMLFEAANQLPSITGGADGLSGVTMGEGVRPLLVRSHGQHRLPLQPGRAVPALRRHAPDRELAVRPVAARRPRERAPDAGHRRAGGDAPDRDLHRQCGDGGCRRRTARADDAVRRARRVRLSALGRSHDHAGAGRRRAALRRPRRRHRIHGRAPLPVRPQPDLLAVLARPPAGRRRAVRARRDPRGDRGARASARAGAT